MAEGRALHLLQQYGATMNRRSFLTGLGAALGLVAVEPVRRYWAVGAALEGPGFDLAAECSRDWAPFVDHTGVDALVREMATYPGRLDDDAYAIHSMDELRDMMGDGSPIVQWAKNFGPDSFSGYMRGREGTIVTVSQRWHESDLLVPSCS